MKNWKSKIIGFILLSLLSLPVYAQGPQPGSPAQSGQGQPLVDSGTYVIGPEDVLDIFVWKETELSRRVPVRMDGKISIPLVGELQAAGLTPLKLKAELIDKLKAYVEIPNVTVTVMEVNSFKVYISGQVAKPGAYTLRSETTFLQFITMVGGFTEWANQRKILLLRKEQGMEKRYTINYKKIISGDDMSQNMVLNSGDTIIVSD